MLYHLPTDCTEGQTRHINCLFKSRRQVVCTGPCVTFSISMNFNLQQKAESLPALAVAPASHMNHHKGEFSAAGEGWGTAQTEGGEQLPASQVRGPRHPSHPLPPSSHDIYRKSMAGGGPGRVSEGRTVQRNVSFLLFWSPASHPRACLSSAVRSPSPRPHFPSHLCIPCLLLSLVTQTLFPSLLMMRVRNSTCSWEGCGPRPASTSWGRRCRVVMVTCEVSG